MMKIILHLAKNDSNGQHEKSLLVECPTEFVLLLNSTIRTNDPNRKSILNMFRVKD